MLSTLAERKKVGNTFPSYLNNFAVYDRVQSRFYLAANQWTILSSVRLLGKLDEEKGFRCIIGIFMVLHHYSRVRQKFDDSSKCLAYNGTHHTVPHGELNKQEIILALEYTCTFSLSVYLFSDISMRVYHRLGEPEIQYV